MIGLLYNTTKRWNEPLFSPTSRGFDADRIKCVEKISEAKNNNYNRNTILYMLLNGNTIKTKPGYKKKKKSVKKNKFCNDAFSLEV